MASVTATKSDQNGLVRSIYLKIGDQLGREKAKNIVERPVDKTALLLKSDVFDPHQGASWCFMIWLSQGEPYGNHLDEVELWVALM